MHLTDRELWTLIHGMGFGALYLLAFAGGIAGLGLGQVGAHLVTSLVLPGSGLSAAGSVELGLKAMAGAVLVGAFGSIWPALRASGLSPAAALRNQ